jgi:hypothetical protein
VPQWPPTLPIYAIRKQATLNQAVYLTMPAYDLLKHTDAQLQALASQHGVRFLSALDALCHEEQCLAVAPDGGHGGNHFGLTAWDNGHLTVSGATLLANKLFGQSGP